MKKSKDKRAKKVVDDILKDVENYPGSVWEDLGRLWNSYLSKHKAKLIFAFILVTIGGALTLGYPLTMRFLFDKVLLVNTDKVNMVFKTQLKMLFVYISLTTGLWTFITVFNITQTWIILSVGHHLVLSMRKNLHEKLQKLHLGYYDKTPTGKIISRVLDDVNVIREWVTGQSVTFLSAIAKLVIGIGVVLYLNWKLTLIVLFVMPLYWWIFSTVKPVIRRTHNAMRRLNANMYGLASERIAGVQVVKTFTRELSEIYVFASMALKTVRLEDRIMKYYLSLMLFAGVTVGVVTGVIVYATALYVKSGVMTIGDTVAFYNIIPRLFQPLNMLTTLITQFQGTIIVVRRVFSLLDEPVEVVPGKIDLDGMTGKIQFQNVTYTYPRQKKYALKNINMSIKSGEKVVLMGPSGSGKTTLLMLLLRFYDPQEGNITVGGVNLTDCNPKSLRQHICMVQQEPEIFSGTVSENIIYGRLDAEHNMVIEAAKQAQMHEFIMTMPEKYETKIGEKGFSLSGGQRQRLALSTALLTKPEVLLLDDITSSLDSSTEARIRDTLNNVLKKHTSLVVTQRISTARNSDKIIVIEKGEITQMGKHEELILQKGFYRRICKEQGFLE